MFTGIVQELGMVRDIVPAAKSIRFTIEASRHAEILQVGDSVACDGVCLTVEKVVPGRFSVCAVPETLSKTTLGVWTVGYLVNLEPALKPSTPLGGHFVLGHVDGLCEVSSVKKLQEGEGVELSVRIPSEFLSYCVYKGSLALSGVSLTIAAVADDLVRFALIPHTLETTNLSQAKPGSQLNFENDILAKYVERQLSRLNTPRNPHPFGTFSIPELENWGYGIS